MRGYMQRSDVLPQMGHANATRRGSIGHKLIDYTSPKPGADCMMQQEFPSQTEQVLCLTENDIRSAEAGQAA